MIHHVQLASPPGSEGASRAFYTGVLGLAEVAKPARLAARGGCRWAQRLTDAGYPATPDGEFPGMRRFYSHDPHGNRLEFLQPVDGG